MTHAGGRLGWYVRRLRSMTPAEIALHGRRAVAYRYDAATWNVARTRLWRRAWEPELEEIVLPGAASSPRLLEQGRIESMSGVFAHAHDELIAEAYRRLEGRATIAGDRELALGRERRFDVDPISGTPWPDRHGGLIDYRRSDPGDPKLVWELERCQELPLLLVAGLLTGEPDFSVAAASRLVAWTSSHPPGRGISWANAFEPAIRAISLAVTFDALRGSPLLSDDDREIVLRSLWQHGRWIAGNLSRYSSANNHLVGELTGLLAIADLVPEIRDARKWRELARDGLCREARLQVLPDGTGAEQAFGYWLFTIDLFLVAASLFVTGGERCPHEIVDALSRAAAALAILVDVNEPEPAFGDADDGRVLILDGGRYRTARNIAASLAALLGDAGARRLAGVPDPVAAILFGQDGLHRFDSATGAGPPKDALLADSGLVVLRRDRSRVLFDVGPLGYLSIAAHGHADALQVVLSDGSADLISDPGTGSYLGHPQLRRRLRSTAAHATVCVDGMDQSDQGGAFLWSRHAQARLISCDLDDGIAVAEHDGYGALPDPVCHRRAVVWLRSGALLVFDRLAGAEHHIYDQTWPLHSSLVPTKPDAGGEVVVAESPLGMYLAVAFTASEPSEVCVADSYFSPSFGNSVRSRSIVHRVVARSGAAHIVALLVPSADSKWGALEVRLTQEGEHCTVFTNVSGATERIRFLLSGETPVVRRME